MVIGCSLFVDPVGKMEEDLYDVCEMERERGRREREGSSEYSLKGRVGHSRPGEATDEREEEEGEVM